jgi:hypothetical protein
MKVKLIISLLVFTSIYSFGQIAENNQSVVDSLKKVIQTGKLIPDDEIKNATILISKEIFKKTYEVLKKYNNYSEIQYDKVHPLLVMLSNKNGGPIEIQTNDDKFSFTGNANVRWDISFSLVGGNKTISFNSSGFVDSEKLQKNNVAKIAEGSADFIALLQCNKIPFSFEKGSLVFSMSNEQGDYTIGTICVYGSDKYFYCEGAWYKQ